MTSSDTMTVPALREGRNRHIHSSGDIQEDLPESKPVIRCGSAWARFVGSAFFAFASTVSSVSFPPTIYDPRRETSSVICFLVAPLGRRISLNEARRLALTAMAKAEQRRAEFAEREATLLAIWEESV